MALEAASRATRGGLVLQLAHEPHQCFRPAGDQDAEPGLRHDDVRRRPGRGRRHPGSSSGYHQVIGSFADTDFHVAIMSLRSQRMTLEEVLATAISRLRSGDLENEAQVKLAVVEPILRALNWDAATDPQAIKPEYSAGQGRVDYALLCHGRPQVFIEAKRRSGLDVRAEDQLFGYASNNGIPLLVLTDGYRWDFYLSMADGLPEERRFHGLELSDEGRISEYANFLEAHLEQHSVSSREARRNAESCLDRSRERERARKAIPAAWSALLNEPDDLLRDLLTERVLDTCGAQPEPDDVEEFLSSVPPVPSLTQRDAPVTKQGSVAPAGDSGTSGSNVVATSHSGESLQDIVRDLMLAVMETFPGTLGEETLQYLEATRNPLGLNISGHTLLRKVSEGRLVGQHNRYWTRVYGECWYVCSQWWTPAHCHNAQMLANWVDRLRSNADQHEILSCLSDIMKRLDNFRDSNCPGLIPPSVHA